MRKRNRAENKKETKRSIVKVSVESRICAVVRVRRKVQAGNSLKNGAKAKGNAGKRRRTDRKGSREPEREGSREEGKGSKAEERGTEQGERTKGSEPSEGKQVTAG